MRRTIAGRIARQIITYILIFFMAWLAFAEDVVSAQLLLLAYAWSEIVILQFMWSKSVAADLVKKLPRVRWVSRADMALGAIFASVLVWNGWVFTGIIFFTSLMFALQNAEIAWNSRGNSEGEADS